MPNTTRHIAVCFDKISWNYWGISFIASLNSLAMFSGQVVVVDFGMPSKAHDFIARFDNYVVIPGENQYGSQQLDFVHTVSNYASKAKGVWAAWDNTCYFQNNINEVFDLAIDKLVCCRGCAPQFNIKSSINTFGYKETVTKDQDRFFNILKKIARRYNKSIGGGFFAGPAELWVVYDKFLEVCLETGFFLPEEQTNQAVLNLFALSFESIISVIDDNWCQSITEELVWDNGFSRDGHKVNVIHIPTEIQSSADSTNYHFRNRFPNLHNEWSSFYNKCTFAPRRIMKPSLGKLKKVT